MTNNEVERHAKAVQELLSALAQEVEKTAEIERLRNQVKFYGDAWERRRDSLVKETERVMELKAEIGRISREQFDAKYGEACATFFSPRNEDPVHGCAQRTVGRPPRDPSPERHDVKDWVDPGSPNPPVYWNAPDGTHRPTNYAHCRCAVEYEPRNERRIEGGASRSADTQYRNHSEGPPITLRNVSIRIKRANKTPDDMDLAKAAVKDTRRIRAHGTTAFDRIRELESELQEARREAEEERARRTASDSLTPVLVAAMDEFGWLNEGDTWSVIDRVRALAQAWRAAVDREGMRDSAKPQA